jgi:tRNA(Ile)-lysidine synthase
MCADAPSPLDPNALFAPLANETSLLLAVSGGPDSVALMLLAAQSSLRTTCEIAVATVDHALRPESLDEARRVGQWARAQGFAHHILTWRGAKPDTRIQERAREARYQLLAQCARDIGAGAIVSAHHADDQAETILFRLTRGSGVAGLAGMASVSTLENLRLWRPLLQLRKAQLEAFCAAAGHSFMRDPSNENPSFARTRLRRLQATLAQQGLDTTALLRLGARAAQAEEALAWCTAHFLSAAQQKSDVGAFHCDAHLLQTLPRELLQRIIAAQIAALEPRTTLRLERLERATERLAEALASKANLRLTLGGAVLTLKKNTMTIEREAPRRSVVNRGEHAPGRKAVDH